MQQLSLALDLPAALSEDSFLIFPCNAEAHHMIMEASNWLSNTLYLYAPKGAGKSHLASIWAKLANAKIVEPHNINPPEINSNCVVEDIENCTDEKSEKSLFHLFNHCKEAGFKLLITSALPPVDLPFALPDLMSRLRACQLAKINEPDDEALAAVLRKQFSDKQLLVDDAVISYLIPRIERSFSAIKEMVNAIDENALREHKNISISLVRKLVQ